jgi:hypothetical protein
MAARSLACRVCGEMIDERRLTKETSGIGHQALLNGLMSDPDPH